MNKTETISSEKGWIARDKSNKLNFFSRKPHKEYNACWVAWNWNKELNSELFPEVKWEDKEPIEAELELTVKTI